MRLALCEDTYDVLADLELLDAGLARDAPDSSLLGAVTWPGAPVVGLPDATRDVEAVSISLEEIARLGYDQAVLVAPDAPDLPGLLVGKLLRALGSAEVAVCPAAGGGLVALAANLPASPWLLSSGVGLDSADALAELRSAAPRRLAVGVGPGWHRVRSSVDLAALDPGLEGWPATRRVRARWPV